MYIPIGSAYRAMLGTTPSDSGRAPYQYSLGSPIGSDRALYWLRLRSRGLRFHYSIYIYNY